MSEENSIEVEPIGNKPVKKRNLVLMGTFKDLLGVGILGLLVLSIAGYGYYSFNSRYTKLNNHLNEIGDTLKTTKEVLAGNISDYKAYRQNSEFQINNLSNKVDTLQTYSNSGGTYTPPPNPIVTIEDVSFFTSDKLTDPNYKLVLVDVLVKNPSNQNNDFYNYFKIKDKDDHQYEEFSDHTSGITLPDGRVQMSSLTLAPKEQTRGTLVFLLTRKVSDIVLTEQDTGKVIKTVTVK
jgi:hypothetical protein